jgi:hypothetical protein
LPLSGHADRCPPNNWALIFDHLDLALKVFPDAKRIEGVITLKLRTKAPISRARCPTHWPVIPLWIRS